MSTGATGVSGARQVAGASRRTCTRAALMAVAMVPLAGCGSTRIQSALVPAGPAAEALADLWWALFWMTAVPAAIVIGLLLAAVFRGRRSREAWEGPASRERLLIIGAGGAVPALILVVLIFLSFRTGRMVADAPEEPDLVVEVWGHQFWWEFRYPQHEVQTANELHLPVGRLIRLELRSADVIHSFWVPQLHGKIDTIPGHVRSFWLQADRAGIFRGQCAEFCGDQHALMAFQVIAEASQAFEAWLDRQRRPATPPVDPLARQGEEVFRQIGCNVCHQVRPTFLPGPAGIVGPDLTHLASRRTLGAVAMPNTSDNLRAWILDPHVRKPGVRMPPTVVEPDRLDALVAYLESLR